MDTLTKNTGIIFSLWLILIIGSLAYMPVLHNKFVNLDDNVMVSENPVIKSLTAGNIRTILSEPHAGLYHPLVLISYALEYHFAGLDPAVYHATNLAFHLISCMLVFWLIYLLCGSKSVAFVSGLIFAAHPLHVESVAWISERKDMLYAVFYLAAMISYLKYRINLVRSTYLLSLLFFVLSLLSKPMAITLPFALLLIDYLKENRLSARDWINKIPFALLALTFGVIALAAHFPEGARSADQIGRFSLLHNSLNASFNLIFYVKKFFIPTNLSCAYPYSSKLYAFVPKFYYYSAILAVALVALAASISRSSKTIGFGLFFFFVTIIPVLQFIPVGIELPGDRYMYIPSIGLIFIVAKFLVYLYGQNSRILRSGSIIATAIITASLAFATFQQAGVWHDSLALWNTAISRYPTVYFSYLNRADAWQEHKDYAKAFSDYEECLRLKPDCAKAYNNRGNLYARLNDFARALADYNEAISLKKTYAAPYYNRAVLLAPAGRTSEAISDYLSAIQLNPRDAMSYNNLAVISARRKEYQRAIELLNTAILVDANLSEAYRNRAFAYACIHKNVLALDDANMLDALGRRKDADFIRNIINNRPKNEQL